MTDPIAHYDSILHAALRSWVPEEILAAAVPRVRTALFAAGCGAFNNAYAAATHTTYELAAIKAARQNHEREGELEIDDLPLVSRSPSGGAYVQSWIWIDDCEIGCPKDDKTAEDCSGTSSIPPDPDDMNEDQSAWARRTFSFFQEITGAENDTALSDLLRDLRHWCDRNDQSYAVADRAAHRLYLAETHPHA